MAHEFLSDDWFDAVREIQNELDVPGFDFTLNLVVTEGPNGDVELHSKEGEFQKGLADDAPTKLIVPYDVAREIFIEGNQQAGTQAFMTGKVKVEGDMTKLMAMQGNSGNGEAQEAFQQRLKDVTV